MEILKRNHMEMIDSSPCVEMKNAINELTRRLSAAEERIGHLEYRVIKLHKKKRREKKRVIDKTEPNIQDRRPSVRCWNICIIGIPEAEMFPEIMVDVIPKIIRQTENHCSKKVR